MDKSMPSFMGPTLGSRPASGGSCTGVMVPSGRISAWWAVMGDGLMIKSILRLFGDGSVFGGT